MSTWSHNWLPSLFGYTAEVSLRYSVETSSGCGLEASLETPDQGISHLPIDMNQCVFIAMSTRLWVPWLWHLWEDFWCSTSALPGPPARTSEIRQTPPSPTRACSLNEICSACTRIWLVQFLCRALTNTLLELCSFLSVCLKPALCPHSLPQPPQYHSPAVPMTHRPIINLRLLFATLSVSSLHSRVSPNPTSSSQGNNSVAFLEWTQSVEQS